MRLGLSRRSAFVAAAALAALGSGSVGCGSDGQAIQDGGTADGSLDSGGSDSGSGPADPSNDPSCPSDASDGDLVIPDDATCAYSVLRIAGNVEVGRGSVLELEDAVIDGTLTSQGSTALRLESCEVAGNIQVEQGGDVTLTFVEVGGQVTLMENSGEVEVRVNNLMGDLLLNQNTGGPFWLSANEISGNLECEGNDPEPTGGNNMVTGTIAEQCRL